MTSTTRVPEATARSELLLAEGGEWGVIATRYLAAHPDLTAAIPTWAREIDFSEIESELDGTIFSFSTSIGDVELYGVGKLAEGVLHLEDGGTPNVYLPAETDCRKVGDISQWMLDLAQDLTSAAELLRSQPRLLRRAANTEEALREREQ